MSFFDDLPPYIPSPPPYAAPETDAIDVVLSLQQQFPLNNEPFIPHSPFDDHDHDHDQPPSFKRARTHSENNNNHSNAIPCPPRMMMMHSQNNNKPASNKGGSGSGTGHIFFKTRMCAKFKLGSCRNGENCNFAHGIEDIRQPPPNWHEFVVLRGSSEEQQRLVGNWDDDQKIIHKMKLCKKYYNGEECPYGERCSFLHEDPAKFREDYGRIRESSAISIGTNGSPKSYRDGYDYNNNSETNKAVVVNMGLNAYRGNVRSTFWKTKLCIKWENTGHCPFGQECHFAHGQSELHVLSGRNEAEAASAIPISTYATIPTLPKVTSIPAVDAAPPSNIASPPLANEVEQGKKCLLKWKGPKKINRIYADWLDDLPLVQNLPSRVET